MLGKLIAIEGIECVGKTSIMSALREKYPNAVFTREPGGTPLAEQLRQFIFQNAAEMHPYTEATLFYAARIEHAEKVIWPALREGHHVFTDRYYWSTLAYQAALIEDTSYVETLHHAVKAWLPEPDTTLWLDASVETMVLRKNARGVVKGEEINQLEDRDTETFTKIRNRFQALNDNPLNGIVRMDAEQPLDEVILNAVNYIKEYVLGE